MNKILVTGGAGFIGSNLCDALLKKGYYVICLDNFSTGHLGNIIHLLDNHTDKFKLIEGDIRSFDTCMKAFSGIDYVFHEAALGSIPRSIEDPITTNEVNVTGFLNVIVAARDAGVKRIIFATSSSAYGNDESHPKIEAHSGHPLSPYALTKQVNELYAEIFAKTFKTEYIGLRYFNVFGPRQDPKSVYAAVIPQFIKQYIEHFSPHIYGDGTNSRDFTYIDNVIRMNLLALKTNDITAINQIYNTACGEETTIKQLSDTIKFILQEYDPQIYNINPIYDKPRVGEVRHSMASIEKAQKLLGYAPSHTFYEGLCATVKWYWHNRPYLT